MDRSREPGPREESVEELLASLERRLASARVLGEETDIIDELEPIVAEIRAALGDGRPTS